MQITLHTNRQDAYEPRWEESVYSYRVMKIKYIEENKCDQNNASRAWKQSIYR